MSEVFVLGAGVSGISAAFHAQKRGVTATVYEARSRAGGLLDGFSVNGFNFDHAVHLSFAEDGYVRSIFDQVPHFTHCPESDCYEAGAWLRHPVQNNLFPLSVEEKVDLLGSLCERPEGEVANYREWLLHQYGRGIAERFPIPYTLKYWTVEAEELGTSWIGNRMRRADVREILRGAMTAEMPNTYYAKEMRYPKQGGYRAFIDPMIMECDIRYNKKVVEVDPRRKYVLFEDGGKVHYEHLISTLPLVDLVGFVKDAPPRICQMADSLWATSVDLVSLGFNRPDVARRLWSYIYDDDILASRVNSPSMKSSGNAPAGCSSLQFEVYSSSKKPLGLGGSGLCDQVLGNIETMGLANKSEVVALDHRRVPYANVVFDQGMELRRDEVKSYIGEQGIGLAGRFGEWDYFWSDQSLLSGKGASDCIITQ